MRAEHTRARRRAQRMGMSRSEESRAILEAKGRALMNPRSVLPPKCICFEDVLGEVFFVKRKDCPVHGHAAQ